MGIFTDDQIDFPIARPMFDTFLTLNGIRNVVVPFGINQ